MVSLFRLYAYHDPDLMKQFLQAPETSIQQKSAEAGHTIPAERCDSPTVRNGGTPSDFLLHIREKVQDHRNNTGNHQQQDVKHRDSFFIRFILNFPPYTAADCIP